MRMLGVAEQLRDFDQLDALGDQQARRAVSQFVKAHPRESGRRQQPMQDRAARCAGAARCRLAARPARRVGGEHEPAVGPRRARLQPLFELSCSVRA